MSALPETAFVEINPEGLADLQGRVVVLAAPDGTLDAMARRVDRLTRKAVSRLVAGKAFADAKVGSAHVLAFPAGMAADAVIVLKIGRDANIADARRAGASIPAGKPGEPTNLLAAGFRRPEYLALGAVLKAYEFNTYRTTGDAAAGAATGDLTVQVRDVAAATAAHAALRAQAEGVYFTRDLISEPANVLTTTEFANRLVALAEHGVEVEVLEEADLVALGMRTLLAVGQGSEMPSKVVVMRWNGGGDEAPFALVGKGVVFDTGGISIKPAAGMEEMTMDMGGAGVVSGVMKCLALRKAAANVVGLVGLVENMPDGRAQRPGDVVKTMKGDTVEVINTDAEGRLVLADVLWYAQERFSPSAIVDLATLTGAVIVALGHENAGVFSNNDDFADAFLAAARAEDEGAWRLPLSEAYDELLKSRIADIANVGGRAAGAVTAAQFLQRFVKPEVPWIHLDIAGAAYVSKDTTFARKGATGWGVRALDALVRARFEA